LASSTITNTGSSVITGNLGLYPGSSITGFPPGSYTGVENIDNGPAIAAMNDATTYFNAQQSAAISGGTSIPAVLDGQTLTPGVYKTGAATLAGSGAGALTFNGAGTYIIYTSSTLTTGAGGTPTMTLSGGATAANIYWIVGSSATINSGHAGVFQGNVLAEVSITDTLGGTVNGGLIALTGAVTLSAASVINTESSSGGSASFTTVATTGTLPVAAVVGDLYLYMQAVNLDSNDINPRYTGNGGQEF
jgi:type VI secretion system secreted protein VgrG